MIELQPGMLAVVIGARYCHENIGKMVEVFGVDGEEVMVKGSGLIGYIEAVDKKFDSEYFWALKNHLLPIKPEADPLDVTHKEELHA
jgi:hypothetical protein